jgi:hypothetical protein
MQWERVLDLLHACRVSPECKQMRHHQQPLTYSQQTRIEQTTQKPENDNQENSVLEKKLACLTMLGLQRLWI